jgi:ligand-binding sensor domain-containing protein
MGFKYNKQNIRSLRGLMFLFFLCLGALFNTLKSQQYTFYNYSVGNGLAQSQVYAVSEDKYHNLWFGTLGGGLSKFDGVDFITYTEEDGLVNNFIRALYLDSNNVLWIGTEGGLNKFDGIEFSTIQLDGYKDAIIKTIERDENGYLLLGTENYGLLAVENDTIINLSSQYKLDNNIYCLLRDNNNSIWIGTDKGLYKYMNNSVSLYTTSDGLPSNIIRDIKQDSKGNYWIATYGKGVSCFDGVEFINYSQIDGLPTNTVFTVLCENNKVWFGTAIGLCLYQEGEFHNYFESNGLCSNVIVESYKDFFGNRWFCSSGGGVSRHSDELFVHYTETEKMGKWVYSVVQDTTGRMWYGTNLGGVTVQNEDGCVLVKAASGFTSHQIRSLHRDNDGFIWLGTYSKGLFKFENGQFHQFRQQQDHMAGTYISNINSDMEGNIWYATLDGGVGSILKDTAVHLVFNEDNGLSEKRIYAVTPDNKGNVWIGSSGNGMFRLIRNQDSIDYHFEKFAGQEVLAKNTIHSIVCDTLGVVYIGTSGNGLFVLKDNRIRNFTKQDGLTSNTIYSMILDTDNQLIIGSERGIDRVSFDENAIIEDVKYYGLHEGFFGVENCRNAVCMDSANHIWFGTVNGATCYSKENEIDDTIPPFIQLTSIRLFFDEIQNTSYAKERIPESLVLPFDKNHLSFSFTGVKYRNAQSVRFKFILEGFDKSWSPEVKQKQATYSNLPAGEYTFRVKASNKEGIWSDEVSFSFSIDEEPPPPPPPPVPPQIYEEPWFIPVVGLIIILGTWLGFYVRLRQIRRINEVEKKRVEAEKNLLELEHEASRLQMNPHFIFNALNSVQGFISSNDPFQAKRYLAKFARLMRLTLENAREEFIPLDSEIELLTNYLELEKLSTKNKFEYSIVINPEVDPEIAEIPPMMIQPFVENAIVHGIKPKEDVGHISIQFSINDNLLVCEIIDDGVGREKAKEINLEKRKGHKSSAMLITKERLDQISKEAGIESGFKIHDLKDENNIPSGTKVIITIPYEL